MQRTISTQTDDAPSLIASLRATLANDATTAPLYDKVASAIRAAVESGQWPIGHALPAEREIAERLTISRVTVRRAIESLAHDGLLTVRHGAGAYLSARIQQPLSELEGFTDDMSRRGYVPGSRWLSRQILRPGPDDLVALGITYADQVLRASRVRTANGEPLAIEQSTVNAASVGGAVEFGDSLYAAMARHGVHPVRAVQRLRAELASSAHADLLNLEEGSAVLAIERRSFNHDGRPVEWTRSVYRGDRYDYVAELNAVPRK